MIQEYKRYITLKNVFLSLSILANILILLLYLFVTNSYKEEIYRLETNLATCTQNTENLEKFVAERNDEIDRINIEAIERLATVNETVEQLEIEKKQSNERLQRILNSRNNNTDQTCEGAMEFLRREAINQ